MKKIITSIGEFFAAEPTTKPTIKPETKPGPAPSRPSPIRRDKPSVDPKPKAATEQEVVMRFVEVLREKTIQIKVANLKKKYSK